MQLLQLFKVAATEVLVFLVASVLCWLVGRKLVPRTWNVIVKHYSTPKGSETELAPAVGGLEGVLYVFAVMSNNYELIAGWLVMKAFYGWISVRPELGDALKPGNDALGLFNEYLIGNLLSLFAGVTFGLGARLLLQLIGAKA